MEDALRSYLVTAVCFCFGWMATLFWPNVSSCWTVNVLSVEPLYIIRSSPRLMIRAGMASSWNLEKALKTMTFLCRKKIAKVRRFLVFSVSCFYQSQFYFEQSLHEQKVWRVVLWQLLLWPASSGTEPLLFDGKSWQRYFISSVTCFQKT